MSKRTGIDEAFERYLILSRLIALEQERAHSNPLHPRYSDLGIVKIGDTKLEAAEKTKAVLDTLAQLIEHVAILDMAGSFERTFRSRISSAIGVVRSLLKKDMDANQRNGFGIKLVKTIEDFEGLNAILGLFEDSLSKRTLDAVNLVRKSRNAFAHGTDLEVPPAVEPGQARESLNEVMSRL